MSGTDLPAHAIRHASGGADPMPNLSLSENMLRAKTIFQGVPAADVSPSANAWTDVVTGLVVTVTTAAGPLGQVVILYLNALVQNTSGSNSPTVAIRVIDGAGTILCQTGTLQYSTQGANNDTAHINLTYPVLLTASPTLKMQVNANLSGPVVRKNQTFNGSTFAVTSLAAVVA